MRFPPLFLSLWACLLTIGGIYFYYKPFAELHHGNFSKATYKLKPTAVSPEPIFPCLKLFTSCSIVYCWPSLRAVSFWLVILFCPMHDVFVLSFPWKSTAFCLLLLKFCPLKMLLSHFPLGLPPPSPLYVIIDMKQWVCKKKQLWQTKLITPMSGLMAVI